ncbi:MAG: hypothetical protein M3Q03_08255 [Chloroflexota bacterium]|nr:hypothetical protein [Chloroflexota bacterium]
MRIPGTEEPAETRRLDVEDIAPIDEELFEDQLRLATGGIKSTFIGTYCYDGDGQYLCDHYDGY